ncbi:uncharacterized protein PpBr36_09949 [Pyricularia pennisetigena]|uniref:uncharacterized protein n=1 Tax=Pyricularia pennisetigena TaxID=1578925 RepID=UPI00114E1705|nr:uncharacterized protein PpBr36_09949 [Pyricularia pennisetigena]TLS22567.1 hypothetical protein PpBr36_09949 [Pyricularia pennisetigena]
MARATEPWKILHVANNAMPRTAESKVHYVGVGIAAVVLVDGPLLLGAVPALLGALLGLAVALDVAVAPALADAGDVGPLHHGPLLHAVRPQLAVVDHGVHDDVDRGVKVPVHAHEEPRRARERDQVARRAEQAVRPVHDPLVVEHRLAAVHVDLVVGARRVGVVVDDVGAVASCVDAVSDREQIPRARPGQPGVVGVLLKDLSLVRVFLLQQLAEPAVQLPHDGPEVDVPAGVGFEHQRGGMCCQTLACARKQPFSPSLRGAWEFSAGGMPWLVSFDPSTAGKRVIFNLDRCAWIAMASYRSLRCGRLRNRMDSTPTVAFEAASSTLTMWGFGAAALDDAVKRVGGGLG